IPAESLCRQSLSIREKTAGPHSPAARQALDNLVYILARQEKYAAAESLTQRAATMLARFKNLYPLETANYLNSQGTFCHLQGKFTRAESLFQSALALREKNMGPDDPAVVKTLDNLAETRKSQKKYEGLDSLYERMIAAMEKNSGPQDPALVSKLEGISRFYESIKQTEKAQKWALRAERVRSKTKTNGNQ
ncbi:MAG TPA: tetratricopeptide repeat protein, partial [Verrucomicrobiae bacterium]|nr:tetratricopeptide repeat protein [Verrucomicrobiae bacterium]